MNGEIDLVFKAEKDGRFLRVSMSRDGGKTWRGNDARDTYAKTIQTKINRYIIYYVVAPDRGEPLDNICSGCAALAKFGVMRFDRRTVGTEEIAKGWWEGDVEVSGDVSYGVAYEITKCDRCGREESDYA